MKYLRVLFLVKVSNDMYDKNTDDYQTSGSGIATIYYPWTITSKNLIRHGM